MTGASSGLSRRFATVLHAAGADVIVTGRRSEQLEQLAGELGGRVSVVSGDLLEESGWSSTSMSGLVVWTCWSTMRPLR